MRLLRTVFLANLLLVAFVYGCAQYGGRKTFVPPRETYKNLVYLNEALLIQIPCENLSAEQLPNGRMRVLARFFNKQNHTAECQVKVRFKDASGKIIDETNWMPLLLPRRELTQFEHTSLTTKASEFVLMLREARD